MTASEASGGFDLRGLRVGGPYKVTISAPGQATKVYDGVYLQVGQTYNLDAEVETTEVEEIVVTASATRDKDNGPKAVFSGIPSISAISTNFMLL